MEQIEIEFKILVTEKIYQQIKKDYQKAVCQTYIQTNFYLMHPQLEKRHYMLRIREKNNSYELTLKRPHHVGHKEMNIDIDEKIKNMIFHHQKVDNTIFDILKEQNIDYRELDCSHFLKTTRTDILFNEGTLSLDKNEYNGIIDYEIEFEVHDPEIGKKKFLDIIQPYHLQYTKNCESKIKRMSSSL